MDINDLKQRKNTIATEMREMVALAEKEDRGFNADEDQKWTNASADLESVEARIANLEKLDSIPLEERASEERLNQEIGEKADRLEPNEVHQRAFSAWLKDGMGALNSEQRSAMLEKRAQATGTDSAGGFTVPEGFFNQLTEGMKAFSGIQQIADVITTDSGNLLPFPTSDDTGNVGVILAENAQDAEQDVTFGAVNLEAYKYTSRIIRVPVELMQDSAFNLDTWLPGKLAERIGRATAAHFATGTGTSQPRGVFAAAPTGVTAASASALTYDELLELKHSVDPAYRVNARWCMNDATFLAIKQLKDGDSRPLWLPNVAGGAPATLDGDAYTIDQGAPAIASGADVVAYGDFSNYKIRIVRDVTAVRMVERYADFHQVGFVAFMRADADLVDAGQNPIKVLTMG